MTRRWPCIVVAGLCCLLAFATSASFDAQAQSASTMPQKITGYGGYRFGMTLEEARRVDRGAVETKCDYTGAAICLEKDEHFYGESGKIRVLFSDDDKRLIGVNIDFSRDDGTEGVCAKTARTLLHALFTRFGKPSTTKPRHADWYAPGGGSVGFLNFCLTDDSGLVVVSYRPSAGF